MCTSIAVIDKLDVGLDQELSVPTDSYVLPYFKAQINSLRVGPPVYFVIKGDFDYANKQLLLCSRSVCSSTTLYSLLIEASKSSNETRIASTTPNNWIDSYIDWSRSCCKLNKKTDTFCPSTNGKFYK